MNFISQLSKAKKKIPTECDGGTSHEFQTQTAPSTNRATDSQTIAQQEKPVSGCAREQAGSSLLEEQNRLLAVNHFGARFLVLVVWQHSSRRGKLKLEKFFLFEGCLSVSYINKIKLERVAYLLN